MGARISPQAGVSQNYQRFAWGTLALAAVVALASTDRGDAPVAAPVTTAAAADAPAAPKMARPAFAATIPEPLEEPDQGKAENDQSDEPGVGGAPEPESPEAQASPTAPRAGGADNSPAAGQLVASSQSRSGGLSQGDDPGARH